MNVIVMTEQQHYTNEMVISGFGRGGRGGRISFTKQ